MQNLLSSDVQDFGIRLALVLLALILLWLLRRLVVRLAIPRLQRLAKVSGSEADDILVEAIVTPFRLIMIAASIYVAAAILSTDGVPSFYSQLARTLVILAVFNVIYKMTGVIMRSTSVVTNLTGLKLDEQLLPFVRTALQVIIVALGIVIVLQEWRYDVGGLIAGLGIGGLAFALAAEDTVSNLFGFTTIVGDRPLVVGEFIKTPDVSGTVEHVGFRSTRIRQLDRAIVTIPNSKLAASVVTNWSRLEKRRIDMTIGLTYNTTSAEVRDFITRIKALLESREPVDSESIVVLFTNFGASSLDIRVICYILLADWGAMMNEQQEIMLAIMDIVEEMGLSFAFPSQSLYIEQTPKPIQDMLTSGPQED
jgi:MscS family membrane protein